MQLLRLVRHYAIVCTVLLKFEKCCGTYVLEVLLHKWENPLHSEFDGLCCYSDRYVPECVESCNPQLEFCLQPGLGDSSSNCPYGYYEFSSLSRSTIKDLDNITFKDLDGKILNPFCSTILEPISTGVTLKVNALNTFGFELSAPIDSAHINFDYSTSENFIQIKQTGIEGFGTVTLSYRISCYPGYWGNDCTETCSDNGSSNANTTASNCANEFTSICGLQLNYSNMSTFESPYSETPIYYQIDSLGYDIDMPFNLITVIGLCLVTTALFVTCSALATTGILLYKAKQRIRHNQLRSPDPLACNSTETQAAIYSQIPGVPPCTTSIIGPDINSNPSYVCSNVTATGTSTDMKMDCNPSYSCTKDY